jgi:inner membrane protein involved in colicin E2 resistance
MEVARMVVLKRVDAVGWAKVYTTASLIVVFLLSLPVIAAATLGGALSQEDYAFLTGPVVIVVVLAALVVVGLVTFIVSWLQALVLNWALARTGGLPIELGSFRPKA